MNQTEDAIYEKHRNNVRLRMATKFEEGFIEWLAGECECVKPEMRGSAMNYTKTLPTNCSYLHGRPLIAKRYDPTEGWAYIPTRYQRRVREIVRMEGATIEAIFDLYADGTFDGSEGEPA